MRAIKINFQGAQPVFDFTDSVKDFDATVQNCLVNLGTMIGSDQFYPDRGTYLMLDAVQGRMINIQWANNSANFAALRTIVFSQNNDQANNPYALQTLTLAAGVYNIKNLVLNVGAVCINGATSGTVANT